MNKSSLWIRVLVTLVLLALAVVIWKTIIATAPKPTRQTPAKTVRLVDTQPLQRETGVPSVRAGGTVTAAEQVDIIARVSGQLEWVNAAAIPGTTLNAGERLARIEAFHYQQAVEQQQAAVIQAETSLQLEQSQGLLAQEEMLLAGQQLTQDEQALISRAPQLASAKATLKSAESLLAEAERNLSRTRITMPFTGQITDKAVSQGGYANTNEVLFSVISTEQFWLEVKLPRKFVSRLDKSQAAVVTAPDGATRSATVLSILPTVDGADQQVRVLLSIENPMHAESGGVVLINDFVEADVFAQPLFDMYRVPRSALVDETYVWVVNESLLRQREVNVVYLGRETAWIDDGFEAGDQLLLSQLDARVEGMKVRVSGADAESDGAMQ